jgi:hypothetical protein
MIVAHIVGHRKHTPHTADGDSMGYNRNEQWEMYWESFMITCSHPCRNSTTPINLASCIHKDLSVAPYALMPCNRGIVANLLTVLGGRKSILKLSLWYFAAVLTKVACFLYISFIGRAFVSTRLALDMEHRS